VTIQLTDIFRPTHVMRINFFPLGASKMKLAAPSTDLLWLMVKYAQLPFEAAISLLNIYHQEDQEKIIIIF